VHVGVGRSLLAVTARASGCGDDVLLRMRRRRPPHDPMTAPQDPVAAASSGSDDGSSRSGSSSCSQDLAASGLCGLRISGTEREGVWGGILQKIQRLKWRAREGVFAKCMLAIDH
jgi:hypothetical protein